MNDYRRTLDERVAEKQKHLNEMMIKVKQHEEQLKALEAKRKEKQRKERTHRLIEVGAAVESVVGGPISSEMLPRLIVFLRNLEAQDKLLSRAIGIED